MKKLLALSVLLLAGMLTGCVSGETHVKINEDGSATVTTTTLTDKSITALDEKDPNEGMKEAAEKNGWSFKEVNRDGMTGGTVSKTFDSYEDIEFFEAEANKEDEMGVDPTFDVKVDEGFFKNTYTLDGKMDLSNSVEEIMQAEAANQQGSEQSLFSEEDQKSMFRMMLGEVDYSMKLTLPAEVLEQNADEVNGQTLTWNIDMTGNNEFHAKAEQLKTSNIVLTAITGLLILGTLIFFVLRRRQ